MTHVQRTTSGLILIGEELLSGKIDDRNGPYTISKSRQHGLKLREIACIGDDIDVIAQTVRRFSDAYDIVITSGGVGPTHDDLTMEGIAAAFDVKLHTDYGIKAKIEEHFGDDPQTFKVWSRMACVPTNCTVLEDSKRLPIFTAENVYILPGVPKFFEHQLDVVLKNYQTNPVRMRTLYLRMSEGQLAEQIEDISSRFPEVDIGSYPVFDHPDYQTRVTFEHVSETRVEQATNALADTLDPRALHAISDSNRLD